MSEKVTTPTEIYWKIQDAMIKGYRRQDIQNSEEVLINIKDGTETPEKTIIEKHYKKSIDRRSFVKIYTDNFYRVAMLPKTASEIFNVILREYDRPEYMNKTSFYMTYKTAKYDHGYEKSLQQYSKAMKQLKDAGIITPDPVHEHFWHVDGTIMFNGDPTKLILRKEQSTQADSQCLH